MSCNSYWWVVILKIRDLSLPRQLPYNATAFQFPFSVSQTSPFGPVAAPHKEEVISQQVKLLLTATAGAAPAELYNVAVLSHVCSQELSVKIQLCCHSGPFQSKAEGEQTANK